MVSCSLMFEAGGQPISGAGGGVHDGVQRILDLMDKHGVKLSSFMIGRAVEEAPDLAEAPMLPRSRS